MRTTEQELALLRAMSPAKKLAVMDGLIRQAFELKAAMLRRHHPDLAEDEVRRRAWLQVSGGD